MRRFYNKGAKGLSGGQVKLDKMGNNDGKISGEDFAVMRSRKMGGGMMKRPMYKEGSTSTKGNIRHGKLKTQKELKKITDSKEYKKSDFGKKTKMLNVATMAKGGRIGLKHGGGAALRGQGCEIKS